MSCIWCLLCFDPRTFAGRLSRSAKGERLPEVDCEFLDVFGVVVADVKGGAFGVVVADVEGAFEVIVADLEGALGVADVEDDFGVAVADVEG